MTSGSPKALIATDSSPESVIEVRVTPRASRSSLAMGVDGVVQAKICAAPVDGGANKALVKLIAETLRIPPSRVSLISGQHSRLKRIRIEGLDAAEVRLRLPEVTTSPRH